MFFSARRRERLGCRGTGGTTGCTLLAPQQQHELDSAVSTRIVHRHCPTPRVTDVGRGDGDCWPAVSMVLVASRGRQWCWWLAGVVSCCTTSLVLEASRGRQLYDVSGVGGQPGSSVFVRRQWCWWLAGLLVVVPGISGWP